jgi:poly(3-hydroxybutyrate) depolymerase
MLYAAYQVQTDALTPLRLLAQATSGLLAPLGNPWPILGDNALLRSAAAACELVSRAGISHNRPPFRIVEAMVGEQRCVVEERVVAKHPFCDLLHFSREGVTGQPRVLVVAPMSGHFATLLRGTVETLLADHDVYITDWLNARNVPLYNGRFGLDDYIAVVIEFLQFLGPRTHVLAVCQPSVPVLAAVSLMAEDHDPATPPTMVLMGGPIDTRRNPTAPNVLATSRTIEWFEKTVIETVPARYPGAFRRVYPGFLQLAGFMTMNLDRHVSAHFDLFKHLVRGDGESASATRTFYDEYTAVMDLPADFYLETVRRVFQEHALPLGTLEWRGRKVDPSAIYKTALFTVEGEKDDICAIGQTAAAHDLCSRIPMARRAHHVQPLVGHYGVFNGRRWRNNIYPKVRDFIAANH